MMVAGFEISTGASVKDRIERLLQQELDLTGGIWPSECKTQGFQGSLSVWRSFLPNLVTVALTILCLQSTFCEQKHSFIKETNPRMVQNKRV